MSPSIAGTGPAAGEPSHDAHQIADRTNHGRVRDHGAGRLGRHPMGRLDARLSAGTRPPLVRGSEPACLSSVGALRLVVNYRIRGRYYVVDRLFSAAELRMGEKRQQVVRIIRGPADASRRRSGR